MEDIKLTLSRHEQDKRRNWQERVHEALEAIKKPLDIDISSIFGKKFAFIKLHIIPGMFIPSWGDSRLLAETVLDKVKRDDIVLDMGTGSGLQAICAAVKGEKVIAVDINPQAVACAKINVERFNLSNKVDVIQSDLFQKLEDFKYSKIIYNPPFRWFKPRSMAERAATDQGYACLKKFFKQARHHLLPDGKIILVFSDSGDLGYLKRLMKQERYSAKLINKRWANGWNYFVYEIKPLNKSFKKITVRTAEYDDLPIVKKIEKKSYPAELQASINDLAYRWRVFGIWLAEYQGKPVGFLTCIPARMGRKIFSHKRLLAYRADSYKKWFDDYYYLPARDNDVLYITSLAIKSDFQGYGIGKQLVKYSIQLAKDLGLKKRVSVLRVAGFNKYAYAHPNVSIQKYLHLVKQGEITDRSLSLYLDLGFELKTIIANYEKDRASCNYGIFAVKNL